MLCCSDGLLHRPKLFVHGLERIVIGVGAQHEDAVGLLLLFDRVAKCSSLIALRWLRKPVLPMGALSPLMSWRSGTAMIRGAVGRILLRLLVPISLPRLFIGSGTNGA
jgi:hypothetical protein